MLLIEFAEEEVSKIVIEQHFGHPNPFYPNDRMFDVPQLEYGFLMTDELLPEFPELLMRSCQGVAAGLQLNHLRPLALGHIDDQERNCELPIVGVVVGEQQAILGDEGGFEGHLLGLGAVDVVVDLLVGPELVDFGVEVELADEIPVGLLRPDHEVLPVDALPHLVLRTDQVLLALRQLVLDGVALLHLDVHIFLVAARVGQNFAEFL